MENTDNFKLVDMPAERINTMDNHNAAYEDFLFMYAGQHLPSADEQRAEIDAVLDTLSEREDYYTLEVLRWLLDTLREETEPARSMAALVHILTRLEPKYIPMLTACASGFLH